MIIMIFLFLTAVGLLCRAVEENVAWCFGFRLQIQCITSWGENGKKMGFLIHA